MELKVRPIRNEQDYDAALREIDQLMDAAPGTTAGDRLDVVVTLVGAFEAPHWTIEAPHPIGRRTLKFTCQELERP
jgi:HTH-type transcriptional regulator/antitoxin HigA